MPQSHLQQLKANRQIRMVQMDGCVFHRCNTKIPFCGTQDLNGCFGVVILSASTKAVLFAHIAPRPHLLDPDNATIGIQHVTKSMDRMIEQYRQHRGSFPDGTISWIVFARHRGKVSLPTHLSIIQNRLASSGISNHTIGYDVRNPAAESQHIPSKGEAFVGFRQDELEVFLEDTQVQLRSSWSDSSASDCPRLAWSAPGAKLGHMDSQSLAPAITRRYTGSLASLATTLDEATAFRHVAELSRL